MKSKRADLFLELPALLSFSLTSEWQFGRIHFPGLDMIRNGCLFIELMSSRKRA
jgi:hypothetical protein